MSVLQIEGDDFTLDGEPFRIISGGLHYFRVHPQQWADRLRKARQMGLNTVETYVPWNLHQPRPDVFRLDAGLDLPAFLDLAAAENLHVLLRPGPYICAEWEGGGLPSWLLAEPDIRLRSQDPVYLAAVETYFQQLLPPLLDRLATRGGPVLAVQVENEFGAYSDDTAHLAHLADLLRSLGVDVPLFTCDQPADLARGSLPGVLATANFGSRARQGLAALRAHQPSGPLMCTEFWIGWFDRWGGHHVVRDRAQVFVDGQPIGVLERENHERAIVFTAPAAGSVLRVLVENQGRVNYGQGMHDRKGLLGPVRLNGAELTGWANRPLPLTDLSGLAFAPAEGPAVGPVFHRGTFDIEEPADTFVHLPGWSKGNVWINGFHLGRHWSRGPQRSLYVPGPVLRPGPNEITVLELHTTSLDRTVELRKQPDLGPTEE
ncbi:beta-galactosidase [Kitasatospora sp. NPDC085879]|uniref:glycoside hydrolase family 35 protein n=1 Tax=Kitasatospora sp. NPDC085879 TaxID=3154769 RepID=UPI003444BDBA